MKTIIPAELDNKQVYKLLTGSIVPRAIAWVSTVNSDGQPNLAPFSYFTAVTANPPTVLFCPGRRGTDGHEKDTYHNVQATGEFVVNFVSADLAEKMNITATETPPEVNEFERAGLTTLPSEIVKPPRVQESPIHFECKLNQIVSIGDGHIVIGEVVKMHFADDVLTGNNYIDAAAYQPIGRLAGSMYAKIDHLFELRRAPSEVKSD